MQNPRTDDMLLAIARESKGIDDLLDTMFSFLRRRTDFFSGATTEKAEAAVLAAARRQHSLAQREMAHKYAEAEAKKASRAKAEAARKAKAAEAEAATKAAKTAAAEAKAAAKAAEATASASATAAAAASASSAASDETSSSSSVAASTSSDKEDTGLAPNSGNGCDHDSYSWVQTLKELTLTIRVPSGIKGRDVAVAIGTTTLSAGIKGETPVLSGELFAKVTPDDCTWTLEDAAASEGGGRLLSIILSKSYGMEWWGNVIKSEPAINLAKVEPENSKMSDLDPETHKTVAKMMFDSRQKAMGKPTSDELEKQSALAKFMAQHPEMDFSQAKLT